MTLPTRKPNRLPDYDYRSYGAYFITICTADRQNLFWAGDAIGAVGAAISRPPSPADDLPAFTETPSAVPLSALGGIVEEAVSEIPRHYEGIRVDHHVIMPNHLHLLLSFTPAGGRLIAAPTISQVIGQFKRHVSKTAGQPLWQKSFHDHVVRNERDYQKIWLYIEHNPWHWETDCFYNKTR